MTATHRVLGYRIHFDTDRHAVVRLADNISTARIIADAFGPGAQVIEAVHVWADGDTESTPILDEVIVHTVPGKELVA